jgi:hypothetical protein
VYSLKRNEVKKGIEIQPLEKIKTEIVFSYQAKKADK